MSDRGVRITGAHGRSKAETSLRSRHGFRRVELNSGSSAPSLQWKIKQRHRLHEFIGERGSCGEFPRANVDR